MQKFFLVVFSILSVLILTACPHPQKTDSLVSDDVFETISKYGDLTTSYWAFTQENADLLASDSDNVSLKEFQNKYADFRASFLDIGTIITKNTSKEKNQRNEMLQWDSSEKDDQDYRIELANKISAMQLDLDELTLKAQSIRKEKNQ